MSSNTALFNLCTAVALNECDKLLPWGSWAGYGMAGALLSVTSDGIVTIWFSKMLIFRCVCRIHIFTHWSNWLKLHSIFWIGESESEVAQLCPTLCDPMDTSLQQAPLSMGFSSQEYWSGLPFPSPGNLPRDQTQISRIVDNTLPSEPPGKSWIGRWIQLHNLKIDC